MRIHLTRRHTHIKRLQEATLTSSAPQLRRKRRFWLRPHVCSSRKLNLYENLSCVRRGIHNKVLDGRCRSLPSSHKRSGSSEFPFCSWAKSAVWICSVLFCFAFISLFFTPSHSPSCAWGQWDHCLCSVVIEIHKKGMFLWIFPFLRQFWQCIDCLEVLLTPNRSSSCHFSVPVFRRAGGWSFGA